MTKKIILPKQDCDGIFISQESWINKFIVLNLKIKLNVANKVRKKMDPFIHYGNTTHNEMLKYAKLCLKEVQ